MSRSPQKIPHTLANKLRGLLEGTCIVCNEQVFRWVTLHNGQVAGFCSTHAAKLRGADGDARWKDNRRKRDRRRVPLDKCAECGAKDRLGRHHEWRAKGEPMGPPIVLCRPCHDRAEGYVIISQCPVCRQVVQGATKLRIHLRRKHGMAAVRAKAPNASPRKAS